MKSLKQLEEQYSFKSPFKNRIKVNSKNIPKELRFFTPYLKFFISEDQSERDELIKIIPQKAMGDLNSLIEKHLDEIDNWLGGEEAENPLLSKEYIYFSILRIMSDC